LFDYIRNFNQIPSTSANFTVNRNFLLIQLVFIIAYAVSTFFMSVYSVAMDTLLACFIADEANQKAKGGKAPMYAPEDLAELIDRD
jgi:hypothetical protein